VSGILLAVAIYAIMFKRFADLNITRIRDLPGDKICIFAFLRWTSYPLVVVMISLGIFLRVYSPIPKPYLAVLYLGIGTSLFIASLRYYRFMFSFQKQDASPPQEHITDK
jgi:glycopeptide antibiotics resistance protein